MFFSSYINLATTIYPVFQGRNLGVILFLIYLFYVPTYLYFLSYCLCHLLCELLQLSPSPDRDLALF